MRTLIYPGTFDPLTVGHVDIAHRAARLCDRLIVAILHNSKKKTVFSVQERVALAQKVLADLPGCTVLSFDGLLVDLFRQQKALAVVRGLRSESDFRMEAQMAAANQHLLADFETCLLPCRTDLAFISSSIVREVGSYGGDLSGLVPAAILPEVEQTFAHIRAKAQQAEAHKP